MILENFDLLKGMTTLEAVKSLYAQAKAQGYGGDYIIGVAQLFN
jgi:hypothetical protein